MRTTITLDDDVFLAVKNLALGSGKRLGDVVSELVRKALQEESRSVTDSQTNLPVFSISHNSPIIPACRAADLLAEEEG